MDPAAQGRYARGVAHLLPTVTVVVAALVASGVAHADGPPASPQAEPANHEFDRPHTLAIAEAGIIYLPLAPISVANRGGSTPFGTIGSGDATVNVGIHLLFQGGKDWAIGAVGSFAPAPTSDSAYGTQAGGGVVKRTHSRSYLFVGAEARYTMLRYRWFQVWTGLAAGGIIIRDLFSNDEAEAVPTILGTRDLTVRSEGLALGVQLGADYLITDHLVVGISARADRWILPSSQVNPGNDPACSSLGDCPTLTGTTEAVMAGLNVGYRLQL